MERRALLGLKPLKTSGGGGGGGQATYVRFPTVTASITRTDGRRGVMTVETGVDVADAALRTRAEQSAPRLRAAYNTVVQRTAQALLPGYAPTAFDLFPVRAARRPGAGGAPASAPARRWRHRPGRA